MKTVKLNRLLILIPGLLQIEGTWAQQTDSSKPNIVMIMADDLGYGDVGFNGNPFIKTPELDKMAAKGLQFTRFYSAAPVCSPTRGSCLTGRHPDRYGIYLANVGHLKKEEVILAEVLKGHDYATGHFGKWHLGTLTKTEQDGRRGGRENEHYSPPWENGFDVCFSTEVALPAWNSMENQPFPSKYWTGPEKFATQNLEGSSSRVIMDRAIPFIESAVADNKRFFAVIWFHASHAPVVAGEPYLELYKNLDENHQHYYGCITDMDEQIGRLRNVLRKLKVDKNTIVFFTSDNGPAGEGGGVLQYPGKRQQGSSGMFRGRKGSLYEGGIRVPALLEWPAKFQEHQEISLPLTTSDYYPTILSLLGIQYTSQPVPLDGIDFIPLITENKTSRPQPIAFKSMEQRAYIDNQYKIYSADDGQHYELYDLLDDPSETNNIAIQKPDLLTIMAHNLEEWIKSCRRSEKGEDYLKREANFKAKQEWQINFSQKAEYVKRLPDPDSLYIFFMAGQSNMAGRGFVEPLDTVPDKRILTIDKANNWIYAKEPLHLYEPTLTGLDCGMSFARKLLESIPDGISIAMIPCAVGGSSIEQWLNNETFRGVALLDNFKSKAAFAQKYGEIKGILWHQGEANATPKLISTYFQKLDSLIKIFRITAKNDSLPILIGELGHYAEPKGRQANWDSINSIIHNTGKMRNICVIETKGLKDKGDKVHFDSESQRELGERFAKKYLDLTLPGHNNAYTK